MAYLVYVCVCLGCVCVCPPIRTSVATGVRGCTRPRRTDLERGCGDRLAAEPWCSDLHSSCQDTHLISPTNGYDTVSDHSVSGSLRSFNPMSFHSQITQSHTITTQSMTIQSQSQRDSKQMAMSSQPQIVQSHIIIYMEQSQIIQYHILPFSLRSETPLTSPTNGHEHGTQPNDYS